MNPPRGNVLRILALAALVVATLWPTFPPPLAQDCIEYGSHARWVASLHVLFPTEVAVFGNHAYVVRGFRPGSQANGMDVVDLSNPEVPAVIGTVGTASRPVAVAVTESHAFLAMQPGGVVAVDLTPPIRVVGNIALPGNAADIALAGNHAFVACVDSGVVVLDISSPESPVLSETLDTPGKAWGVTVSKGLAYIADGAAGVHILDVSDPMTPTFISTLDTPGNAVEVSPSGSLLSVADGVAGLTLIDVADPSTPVLLSTTETPAHSVAVASDERYAYLGQANQGGLAIFDLANPAMPVQVGSFRPSEPTIAVTLQNDLVYCLNGPKSGWLNLVDVSNPTTPAPIGSVSLLRGKAVAISGDQAMVASEGQLIALDVSVVSEPIVTGSSGLWFPGQNVAIHDSHAYVAEGAPIVPRGQLGGGGLQVFDISNPAAPAHLSFGGAGYTNGVAVDGNLAFLADVRTGLLVLDITDPAMPVMLGISPGGGFGTDVAIEGEFAFVTAEAGHLRVVDCTEPASPREVATVPISGLAIAVANHMLCVASSGRFYTVDVTDPEHPVHLGTAVVPPAYPTDVAIAGTRAYVASESFGLTVIDLSTPEAPRLIGGAPVLGGAYGVAVDSRAVYVAGGEEFVIFPRQCPGPNPVEIGSLTAIAISRGIQIRWSAIPNRFTGYWVERAPSPDPHGAEYVVLNPTQAVPGEGPLEFLDSDVIPGQTYAYRLRAVRREGGEETIGPVFATAGMTSAPRPNLKVGPNPSSGPVTFTYELQRDDLVQLEIYDTTGRLVRTLAGKASGDGRGSAVWDGRNAGGQLVASGRYMARISSAGGVASASLVLLAK